MWAKPNPLTVLTKNTSPGTQRDYADASHDCLLTTAAGMSSLSDHMIWSLLGSAKPDKINYLHSK
jgi:hypothetical protein